MAAVLQLSASPTGLSFGNVTVGSSGAQVVTLTNTGNSSVSISQTNVAGAGFGSSGLTPPLTLAAGQTATFSVTFAPTSAGSVSGSVNVVSSAPNSPTIIPVSGTGVQPQLLVVPGTVSFGTVVIGNPNTQAIALTNSGTANLTVSQATLSGSGFALSGLTVPLTLAPGQSTSFNVAFSPVSPGGVTGGISLVSNTPNSPSSIPLSGTGVAAVLQLSSSPTSLSFGNVAVGSSGAQVVTLTSTGNSSVSISQIKVAGAGFGSSGLTPPLTLAAGQTATFSVTFAPTSAGSVIGSASVISNASNAVTIALTGSGVQPIAHTATLTWSPSASVVTGYNIYRGSVSGGPYVRLSSTAISATSYVDSTVQSGQTYFYVVTAVDSNNVESVYSNQASAIIPVP